MSFSFVPYGMNVLSAVVVNIFKCFCQNEALQLKCTVNIVLCLHASLPYWQKAALIKGIQWCTIWVTKYATKHNIRHVLATRCCIRKYVPCGVIWSAQPMPRRLEMQTKDLRLMHVDWSFIDSFWLSTVPAMFEQWGWICPVNAFEGSYSNFSPSHLYMTLVQCHHLKCWYEGNRNLYWQLWKGFVACSTSRRYMLARIPLLCRFFRHWCRPSYVFRGCLDRSDIHKQIVSDFSLPPPQRWSCWLSFLRGGAAWHPQAHWHCSCHPQDGKVAGSMAQRRDFWQHPSLPGLVKGQGWGAQSLSALIEGQPSISRHQS